MYTPPVAGVHGLLVISAVPIILLLRPLLWRLSIGRPLAAALTFVYTVKVMTIIKHALLI
jgi:hypothetical protein